VIDVTARENVMLSTAMTPAGVVRIDQEARCVILRTATPRGGILELRNLSAQQK